ncbi:MAG: response regulator transcription factor [Ignavibacteria bacterium]|nr:response regulator transcription factor [Ignavibacteria bacterium]
MDNAPRILVVDDEVQIRRLLEMTLGANGFHVILQENGAEGLRSAGMDRPELVILDLGLPDMDGIEVLRRLREWTALPVIVLSVRNTERDIVSCLDAGADDYLVKPFRTQELVARVRAALRHRPGIPADATFTCADLEIDFAARVVKKSGVPVKLTGTEYAMLTLFARNAGRVLTHQYILEQVWGPSYAEETQYTRVYVAQLRKKLEDDPARPARILTESGIGYRFRTEED